MTGAKDEDRAEPEFATGVAEAATPAPTPVTVPAADADAVPGPGADEPTQTAIAYADPVDPWAVAEAASIAAGGKPSYAATPAGPGGTWTITQEPAPRRPRRRGPLIGGVTAAVVIVIAAVTAAVLLRPAHPALDYHRVEQVGRITPQVPLAGGFNDVEVLGDRIYLAGVDTNGDLRVLAADPGPRWETTAAGRAPSWRAMRVTPAAVVLFSGPDSATSTSRVVALDAGDGRLLWEKRVGYDDDVQVGADTVLWSDRTGRRLVGLALGDGTEKWSQPDEDSTTLHPVGSPDDLTGPADPTGRAVTPAFTTFVQLDANRTVTVRDLDTGRALQTRENVASPSSDVVAHDGRLIVVEPGTPKRIFEYDLAKLATEPKSLHTVGSAEDVDGLAPCGEQLCFLRTTGYDRSTSEIVAVGGTGWTLAVPETETLVPVGENGLLAIGDEGTTLIVDRKKVWTLDGGVAARLDGGNVLRFSEEPSTAAGNRVLSGFHLGDEAGDIEEMGEIRDVRSESCAWNTSLIACATAGDFVIHSFA